MKRSKKIAVALISVAAVGAAVSIPALAHGPQGGGWMQGWQGGPGMMRGYGGMGPSMMGDPDFIEQMQEMHPQMGGMMGGMGGPGMMGAFFGDLDADGDGTVSADEVRNGLSAVLTENDGNGDGTLSLEEFQALHDDAIRPQMVDRFQAFDEDDDGQLTPEEFAASADWMAQIQARHAAFWQNCPWLQDDDAAAAEDKN